MLVDRKGRAASPAAHAHRKQPGIGGVVDGDGRDRDAFGHLFGRGGHGAKIGRQRTGVQRAIQQAAMGVPIVAAAQLLPRGRSSAQSLERVAEPSCGQAGGLGCAELASQDT